MRSTAASPEEYIAQLPQDRKEVFVRLRSVILKNLPEGFSEGINYEMIGYFVRTAATHRAIIAIQNYRSPL